MFKPVKKILFFFFFIFYSATLSAQDTWMAEIPYETYDGLSAVRDLIKTNDNGFLVLINKVVEEDFFVFNHSMYKYNSDGQLEWEKHYDFGVSSSGPIYGGANPIQIIQLSNDNFLSTGIYVDSDTTFSYSFITNLHGDSLFFNQIISLGSLSYVNDRIFASSTDVLDNKSVTELSVTGQIINQIPLNDEEITRLKIDEEGNIFSSYQIAPQKIKKFNSEGNFLADFNLPFELRADLLSLNEESGVTIFRKDLIKLDGNLNEVWTVPFEEIFQDVTGFSFNSKDIIHTEDEGYVLAGYRCGGLLPCQAYIIKYDMDGIWEWGGVYDTSLPLEIIHKIVEVEDGYVFVGAQETFAKLRLIKLNRQGLLTNIQSPIESPFSKISLYPNPSHGIVNINFTSPFTGLLKIYNLQGHQVLYQELNNQQQFSPDISNLPAGFYFVNTISGDDTQSISIPFVKF